MTLVCDQSDVRATPEQWGWTSLGALGSAFGGLTGKTKADFGHGAARYITFMNVMANTVIDCGLLEKVNVDRTEAQNRVVRGDLFFNGSSETPEEVGMCAVLMDDVEDVLLNSFCFGFRLRGQAVADGMYLAYFFRSGEGRALLASLAQGSTRYNLSKRALLEARFPLPPFAEQEAIADALSDADALIESIEQLIAKKRQVKQGAMQELLTGKRRLPGFSGEWELKRLGELGSFMKGSGVPRSEADNGNLACVRYGELYTRHDDYIKGFHSWISHEIAATATPLKQGDILFAASGETKEEIGKCAAFVDPIEAYAGGDIVILRPANANALFLGYYLNTESINRQKASKGQGDAVVHISARALGDLRITIPSSSEQAAIAAILRDMDAELAALDSKLAKARAVKQGMMQELLTGKTRLV